MHQDSSRYFSWSNIPLDSNPPAAGSCPDEIEGCVGWEGADFRATLRVLQTVLMLSALPAFLLSLVIVHGLARLGVSEVVSFMSATPTFIVAWFYFIGWLLDRLRNKRSV